MQEKENISEFWRDLHVSGNVEAVKGNEIGTRGMFLEKYGHVWRFKVCGTA
jgi:hypothetical protein